VLVGSFYAVHTPTYQSRIECTKTQRVQHRILPITSPITNVMKSSHLTITRRDMTLILLNTTSLNVNPLNITIAVKKLSDVKLHSPYTVHKPANSPIHNTDSSDVNATASNCCQCPLRREFHFGRRNPPQTTKYNQL
jgi:hypothetical protein